MLLILKELGVAPRDILGYGGEAVVFAYGETQVARVHYGPADGAAAAARQLLLKELQQHRAALPFAIPQVQESCVAQGRLITFETRLPGRTLAAALLELRGAARHALLLSALEASRALGKLPLTRPWFGDLCQGSPIRTSSWRAYLRERARVSLAAAGAAFASVDVDAICAPFDEPATPGLVHLDLYPGNLLVEDDRVTAVLDFGGVPVFGDPDFEPLSFVTYLRGDMTEGCDASDFAFCQAWLEREGLAPRLEAVERWVAAMWSFAVDDAKVQAWCRRVLVGH
jgi:Phosphotransferase enzyme family